LNMFDEQPLNISKPGFLPVSVLTAGLLLVLECDPTSSTVDKIPQTTCTWCTVSSFMIGRTSFVINFLI